MDLKAVVNTSEYQNLRWSKLRSNLYWHKFAFLDCAKLSKEFLLRLLLNSLQCVDFLPFKFHVKKEHCVFYARDCLPAIDQLIRMNLQLQNPQSNEPIILQVEFLTPDSVTSVQPNPLVSKSVIKRYDSTTSSMDLSSFHKNPDFEDIFFYALSVPKLLNDVTTMCLRSIMSLNLSNNALECVDTAHLNSFTELRKLNLSNNELGINGLESLRGLGIKELILDGNPLCSKFDTEQEYANIMRRYFPELKKLDGMLLCPAGPARFIPFFLCAPEKQLVEQFTEYYFSLYDSPHRSFLSGLYHADAQFSMTTSYLPNQTTSASAKLTRYVTENRNLIRLSDYNKINKLVRKGPNEITDLLCKLPATHHDTNSFTIDLIYHSKTGALLTMSGVFKEPDNPNVSLRFFKRQFTLLTLNADTYQIVNEMFFITNSTTGQAQVKEAFNRRGTPILPYLFTWLVKL
ncbi:hypothetical protein B566_EDAN015655 [Ephemera danica]|nr:hypothetical protein B566_EDAN015655 [Ephemera danica]